MVIGIADGLQAGAREILHSEAVIDEESKEESK